MFGNDNKLNSLLLVPDYLRIRCKLILAMIFQIIIIIIKIIIHFNEKCHKQRNPVLIGLFIHQSLVEMLY